MPSPKKPKDSTLRDCRESAGLTQKQVGQKIITTHSNISHKETRYVFDDHSVRFVREYVEACGGTLKITIEVNDLHIEL